MISLTLARRTLEAPQTPEWQWQEAVHWLRALGTIARILNGSFFLVAGLTTGW